MYQVPELDEVELEELVSDVSASIRQLGRLRDRIKGTSIQKSNPNWGSCMVLLNHLRSLKDITEHCVHHLEIMCGAPVKDDTNGTQVRRHQA